MVKRICIVVVAMDEEVKVLADAKKLSMAERVAHAHWKARNAAYIDMQNNIERSFDISDPCLNEYGACNSSPSRSTLPLTL